MPLVADLYLDRIDLPRHLTGQTCEICRVGSLAELVERLGSGQHRPGLCPHWPSERVEAFRLAINADGILPTIPSLNTPRPTETGVFDLNGPTAVSPLLVTGNSRLTHQVLLAVLSTVSIPMWMVSVDTGGHTVDMSLVYGTLTPQSITAAICTGDWSLADFSGRIILPGLAAPLAAAVGKMLGRPVEVGPVCAAELPLFFAAD